MDGMGNKKYRYLRRMIRPSIQTVVMCSANNNNGAAVARATRSSTAGQQQGWVLRLSLATTRLSPEKAA